MSAREKDPDIIASRAKEPTFFKAPHPEWSDIEPSPYQHAAVEYRIARRHCLIGDAPGLGKTGEALLYGNAIQAKYTLCVVPASLRLNWEREVRMWSNIENVSTYPVIKSKDGVSLNHNFVIISYDLLRNGALMDALLDVRWDHMILDEAQALKDPKGNSRSASICGGIHRGQDFEGLQNVTDRITLLSGTILPNQPIECYNAVRLMNWDAIDKMSLDDFREEYYSEGGGWVRAPRLVKTRMLNAKGTLGCTKCGDTGVLSNGLDCGYCEDVEERWINQLQYSDKVRNQPVNLDDLQYRLRKHVMVRRLKEDVLDQLPEKRWHLVPMEPNAAIRRALKNPAWRDVEKLYELDPDAFKRGIPVDGEISTAMRQLGEAKAPLVADYIEELLGEGVEKLIVGAWHRNTVDGEGVAGTGLSVLHYLRQRLKKYGLVYMDGTTTARNKQFAVDDFQNDEGTRVILGQLGPLGLGWTLTAAQDAVLAEFYWVPGMNDQFLDRIHRRGQEGDYIIGHVPIVPDSPDERVIGTAVWKDRNIHQSLDAEL